MQSQLIRRAIAPAVFEFGLRILEAAKDNPDISMRELIDIAGKFFKDSPNRAALLLAGLVAIDMEKAGQRVHPDPSIN